MELIYNNIEEKLNIAETLLDALYEQCDTFFQSDKYCLGYVIDTIVLEEEEKTALVTLYNYLHKNDGYLILINGKPQSCLIDEKKDFVFHIGGILTISVHDVRLANRLNFVFHYPDIEDIAVPGMVRIEERTE